MVAGKPYVDPYLFEHQFEAFRTFVEEQSGVAFVSFGGNPYTDAQEGYKYNIHRAGRDALEVHVWRQADVGSGKIVDAVVKAIEIKTPIRNNLVPWEGRYGEEARPHQPLYEAKNQPGQLQRIEEFLFKLYRDEQDERSFAELIGAFGKTYPLLAYLFFLTRHSRNQTGARTIAE